jgi:hypothetical protein
MTRNGRPWNEATVSGTGSETRTALCMTATCSFARTRCFSRACQFVAARVPSRCGPRAGAQARRAQVAGKIALHAVQHHAVLDWSLVARRYVTEAAEVCLLAFEWAEVG